MAFLSDVNIRIPKARAARARRTNRRLNWRLLLALAFNVLAWVAIVRIVGALI